MNTPHRFRHWFSFARVRTFAVAVAPAVLLGVGTASEPPRPASAASGLSDVVLARSALAALDAEADLKGVNLVVSVVNGVAVIGGPVPNAGVAKRAERVVRQIEGVKEVRNTCFVSTGPDPLLKAVAEKASSQLPPRPVMGDLPGILGNPSPQPVSPFPASTVAAADSNSTVVARKPAMPVPGTANILGAPVGPVDTSAPPTMPTTAPGQLTGSASGILSVASAVKKTEARFAGLTVEIRDGGLVVGGSAPQASDAWDFAKRLQQLPGVSRVVVGSVKGK
jgi:hypothetical protein